MQVLRCGRFRLELDRPRIMAIVNVTPDSFSGDGLGRDLDAAVRRAQAAVDAGADLLDIGGESTRPGSEPVSEQEELDRVIPLVERLADWAVPVSIDTFKPAVMRESLRAGASLINDINAFRAPGAIDAVRDSEAALCVMHMQGEPRGMQSDPRYDDVVAEVLEFLERRVRALTDKGVGRDRILLDPGFGFGKTLEHNLALFRTLDRFVAQDYPMLVGVSRKSMLGAITGRPVGERVHASVAAALIAVGQGAQIVRVHDVAATRDALKVWQAVTGVPA
ncbi:dihydropteroate synthase [Aromatoleum bremense]|uniref:dihydropteroate synthase n=1 Tax=Aromatoleum bremense TaxID=76115 RepID=A0ABX1NUU4_9RHOO|nr:dihydropteroate synthase [Aromatoleum bremense]NMG15790.1 dihydropteroate synthase [Aromatoleum bremense]QTQ30675.1 Dihydropteroate synthase [Aromatoleum bremense]